MSAEPALPRPDILAAVRAAYGLELTDIRFLSDGTAHAYRLEGRSGRCFLKLLPNTPYGRETAERLQTEGVLLSALRQLGLPRVQQLMPTLAGSVFLCQML